MAEDVKKTEEVIEKPKAEKKVDLKKWKNRKLKVVNEMTNKVKAEAAARRILRNS